MPNHPTESSQPGAMPVLETRRGMVGAMLNGLWMPLPIMGGSPEGEGDNNPPPNDPPPPPPPPTGDDTPASREATETIRRLRDEIRDLKPLSKELADAKTKLGEYEKAQLTETEKLQRERDEATARATETEARARQRVIRSEVRVVASELGFADPSDAHRFLDDDAIELDDDGEPKNVKALLEKLAKDKSYLLKTEGSGAAGPPRTPRSNGHQETHEERVGKTLQEMETRYRLP